MGNCCRRNRIPEQYSYAPEQNSRIQSEPVEGDGLRRLPRRNPEVNTADLANQGTAADIIADIRKRTQIFVQTLKVSYEPIVWSKRDPARIN